MRSGFVVTAAVNTTEAVSELLPSIVTNTWMTPKDIFRVDSSLDFKKLFVILSPKGMLPVRFARKVLLLVSDGVVYS